MTKYVGILTAGGDSPGLNAAIRAIGKAAKGKFEMQVIGFRDGFRGLMENRTVRLDEERLRYAGSVVLGLNDALVELTGALAGLTLALQNGRLIALSGLITGIAASLSMAASEYLSTRSEDTDKHPVRAAIYTGIAYIITVALLVLPYLLMPENFYLDLVISLTTGVLIIAIFNYYISIAKDEPFKKSFFEMAGLSLGVATFSFIIGYFIRQWLGVDI